MIVQSSSKRRQRRAAGRRTRAALTGALVVLAALVMVPAASADGWQVQSVTTDSAPAGSALSGVACPYQGKYSTTSPCKRSASRRRLRVRRGR